MQCNAATPRLFLFLVRILLCVLVLLLLFICSLVFLLLLLFLSACLHIYLHSMFFSCSSFVGVRCCSMWHLCGEGTVWVWRRQWLRRPPRAGCSRLRRLGLVVRFDLLLMRARLRVLCLSSRCSFRDVRTSAICFSSSDTFSYNLLLLLFSIFELIKKK